MACAYLNLLAQARVYVVLYTKANTRQGLHKEAKNITTKNENWLFNSLVLWDLFVISFICDLCAGNLNNAYEMALRWRPQYFLNEMSTLAHMMTQCHKTTSPYLNQWSTTYMDITKSEWVKTWRPRQNVHQFADSILKLIFYDELLHFYSGFSQMCSQGSKWQ